MTYYNTPDGPLDPEVDLDLTSEHLNNLDGVELKPTLKFFDLTANRLRAIDPRILALPSARPSRFGAHALAALADLEFLSLRQNLLTDVSSFASAACKGTLRELVLHDNKVTEVPNLSGFSAFTRLEFSYNEIKSMDPLKLVDGSHLAELYMAVNKIPEITGIKHFTNLEILEMGSNRLREISGLEQLVELKQLWLGRNRITAIEGLSTLTNLRQISIQANRLVSMKGIGVCSGLEELYLSQNGIKGMEDLENLPNLKVLDLAQNAITKVEGLEHQTVLTDLWLNDNPIADLDHLDSALTSCKETLATLYLENSPASKSKAYLHIMKAMLPALEYLDSTPICR